MLTRYRQDRGTFHAKFSRNWSIHSRDIAIFRFFKWTLTPTWIFEITKFYWLTGSTGSRHISLPNIIKIGYKDIKICRFFKMRPLSPQLSNYVKFHWHTVSVGPRLIIVLYVVKIALSIVEILQFFKFLRWPPPPSLIFELTKFYWLTGNIW